MRPLLSTACACSLLGLASCVVSAAAEPPPAGTLVVDWTIHGVADPNECNQFSAAFAEVIVVPLGQQEGGTFTTDCEASAESISLEVGDYSASAVLLDAGGNPRTTRVDLGSFTILENDELDIPIDFPGASFF